MHDGDSPNKSDQLASFIKLCETIPTNLTDIVEIKYSVKSTELGLNVRSEMGSENIKAGN